MKTRTLDRVQHREEALRQEIVSYLSRLRRFARSLAKDPDKADDLVQAACERALGRLSHLREGTRLDSWLYRIMYTRWIDKMRRGKTRAAKLVVLADASQTVDPGRDMGDYLDTAMDIRKAFDNLPVEHQVAITLVSVEGYSYDEAALVLDVPVGTVASRVARARAILGKSMAYERRQGFLQPPNRRSGERGK
jgi:RNA polymerase sigma-70 factor, ECF subfamily